MVHISDNHENMIISSRILNTKIVVYIIKIRKRIYITFGFQLKYFCSPV